MKPTKKFILENALVLFNEKGFVNVRLQHIADSASVSVGHLAYHFKNKAELIFTLYNEVNDRQKELLAECRVLPLFDDIDYLLRSMFELQQQYRFFYVDTLEIVRAFPEIAEKHKLLLQTQRQQTEFMLEFNSSRGSFKQPTYKGQFVDLGHIFCMSMDNWLAYQHINGNQEPSVTEYRNDMWSILSILFTDMALPEFRQLGHDGIKHS